MYRRGSIPIETYYQTQRRRTFGIQEIKRRGQAIVLIVTSLLIYNILKEENARKFKENSGNPDGVAKTFGYKQNDILLQGHVSERIRRIRTFFPVSYPSDTRV